MPLRVRAFAVGAVLAVAARATRPSPPERTVAGLAALLGAAAEGVVRPDDVAWEPAGSAVGEALFGRGVVFLAASAPGAPRDVYRARVRLTLEGRPISVGSVRNLSSTPLGDEGSLVASGALFAYATASEGKVDAASVLDVRGRPPAADASWLDGAMAAVTAWQETGNAAGLTRADVALDRPASQVALRWTDGALALALDASRLTLDPASGQLSGDVDATGARVVPIPTLRKRPILWAVDTVRAEIGPDAIAWLEAEVFDLRDRARRALFAASGPPPAEVAHAAEPAAPVLDASKAGEDGGFWPPAPIASIFRDAERGEGRWEPVTLPFLRKLARAPGTPEPPPYFYQTTVRPDAQRPYAKVLVVAIDVRQLELDMEGGVEDPKSLTGARGAGKIPRDPRVLGRVVGAFNGAFKTTHGEYGMMVHRRVLLPPKPDAATVVVTRDARVGLGTWRGPPTLPDDVVSFRQNLEPLVEDGKLSPSGRTQWGWQLAGTSMLTERSGICVTEPGHLYYVWGDEVSAPTLGKAMLQVGCTYGMHLDMNPHHTGFVFASVRDLRAKDYDAKLLTPQMEIQPDRYLEYSPKDFFYLMLREPRPAGELGWAPDVGVQPAPAWLPGFYRAVATPEAGDAAQVELLSVEPGRVGWSVRAATRDARDGSGELSGDDAHRVVAAFGLGAASEARPTGLVVAGRALVASRGEAWLVAAPGRDLAITAAGPAPVEGDAIELPLIVDDAHALPPPRDHGLRRRAALGVTAEGRAIVASATAHGDEPLAAALVAAGCLRAVALDRGGHAAAFVHRAGTPTPPLGRYDQAALYALGRPMTPRAFRWSPPPAASP